MRYQILENCLKQFGELQQQAASTQKQTHSGLGPFPPAEVWEPQLRKQVVEHPRLAINLSLLAGVLIGCWVKR